MDTGCYCFTCIIYEEYMTALVPTASFKTKFCPKCGETLPVKSFTSTRAKYCKPCLFIHKLELRNAMIQRSLDRSKTKKQKTVGIVRISDLKKEAQKYFNKYIRERDKDLPCISCGATTARAWHAGHYWAQGMSGALRFNENNVHKQCDSCNVWKHGNPLEYRMNLLDKIGHGTLNYLDLHHHDTKKYAREELESIITKYKELIK